MALQYQKLLIGVLAGLLLLSLEGCWQLRRSHLAAQAARSNWQSCQQLSDQMEQLRQQPLLAGLDERSGAELSRQVTAAVTAIGLPAASIRRIDPRGATQIGDTAYRRQSTIVQLQQIDLMGLVTVLTNLIAGDAGLHVTSLQLTQRVGAVEEVLETWDAEVTLTRLIFKP